MSDRKDVKRIICIFLMSLIVTLVICFLGNWIKKNLIHQRMAAYAVASARVEDGAVNKVVMNGIPGYLGYSTVYLKYLRDGYIQIKGDNSGENNEWKLLSQFFLDCELLI